jgi:hypothetical protein
MRYSRRSWPRGGQWRNKSGLNRRKRQCYQFSRLSIVYYTNSATLTLLLLYRLPLLSFSQTRTSFSPPGTRHPRAFKSSFLNSTAFHSWEELSLQFHIMFESANSIDISKFLECDDAREAYLFYINKISENLLPSFKSNSFLGILHKTVWKSA